MKRIVKSNHVLKMKKSDLIKHKNHKFLRVDDDGIIYSIMIDRVLYDVIVTND